MKLCDGSITQKKRQHVMSFLLFSRHFFVEPASARSSLLAKKNLKKKSFSSVTLSKKKNFPWKKKCSKQQVK
jgi:hypothetical protein